MSITLQRIEYHQVHSYMTYEIEEDAIVEEFGSVHRFQDIGFTIGDEYYEADEEVTDEDIDKFMDFVHEHDYEREDDWFTDRKGGYEVDYVFPNAEG